MHPVEAMEMMTSRLRKTKSNAEFLMSMNMS
jgi:transcription termination factor Rho